MTESTAASVTVLQCKQEIPSIPGLEEGQLTVGREFLLVCEGEIPRELKIEQLKFINPMKYQIKLLGFEMRSASQADIKVTSYTAGAVRLNQLQLTDGVTVLNLGDLGFAVNSVLEKPNPQQTAPPQQPFGPIGPLGIQIPQAYTMTVLVLVIVLVAALLYKVFRVFRRKHLLEKLRTHEVALSPISEFHKTYRQMQRSNAVFYSQEGSAEEVQDVLDLTQKAFKLFLTRKYQVPALEWSDRSVLKDLKKYHPKVYSEFKEDLAKLLKEFQRANLDRSKLNRVDVLALANKSRVLTEKMERGL